MRKIGKILLYIVGIFILLLLLFFIGFHLFYGITNTSARSKLVVKKALQVDGRSFRDLNGNGSLDIYEDSRQTIDARVEDLINQMTIEEKAGLMFHPPIGIGKEGEILGKPNIASIFLGSTYDYLINRKLRTFNLFRIPDPSSHLKWYNELQKIAEQDRLGIPVSIASDPRHGVNNFIGGGMLSSEFSKWPEAIGLAATADSALVAEFGRIAAAEMRSLGIRIALHPMADLATEPRWARINGTFGEDADLSSRMIKAYVVGMQGPELGPASVACMTKHWPGGGPQDDGWEAHFSYGKNQTYPGNNFDYHLKPFLAAIDAGTAMMMPYYGVPVGITSEDVGMSFNREIVDGLLRKKYGFEGVVCTDWGIIEGFGILGFEMFESPAWGMEEQTTKERLKKAIDAGVDQMGGASNIDNLIELIEEKEITEGRIEESARRILRSKFQLGLFDNPYLEANALNNVGRKDFVEKGKLAQRKSIVLLKNEMNGDSTYFLPRREKINIYSEGIDSNVVSSYGNHVNSVDNADVAILRINAPFEPRDGNLMETFMHQGRIYYTSEEMAPILQICDQLPTIICIYLERPTVLGKLNEKAAAVLADFGAADDAVLDIIFGRHHPSAKLPFELPSSPEAVDKQLEDMPYDSGDPLYPFGHGLEY